MKHNKSVISIIMAVVLCLTAVFPALGAEMATEGNTLNEIAVEASVEETEAQEEIEAQEETEGLAEATEPEETEDDQTGIEPGQSGTESEYAEDDQELETENGEKENNEDTESEDDTADSVSEETVDQDEDDEGNSAADGQETATDNVSEIPTDEETQNDSVNEAVTLLTGSCGTNASYTLQYKDESLTDGALSISGTGKMTDYRITDTSASDKFPITSAPWSNSDVFQITSVSVGSGISYIGNYAFCGAAGVTDLEIAGTVSTIGAGAFWGCASLTEVTIPDGVGSIGTSAFYYCTNMSTLYLPSSIYKIDKSAFYCCTKLKDVYFDGTEEQWDALVASGIESYRNENLLEADIHFKSGTRVTLWQDSTSGGNVQNQIYTLKWSGGNFFWDKAEGEDVYDHFYMQIEWEDNEELKGVNTVDVTLPEGFSVDADVLIDSTTVSLNGAKAVLEVFPIYTDNDSVSSFNVGLSFYANSNKSIRSDMNMEAAKIRKNDDSGKVFVSDQKYSEVGFSSEWFSGSSYTYNNNIAVLNAALSCMAYLPDDQIRTSYYNLGFSDVEIYHGSQEYYGTTVNCSMARKKMAVNGKIVTIVALPVRGTSDKLEWVSNLNLGFDRDHSGFEDSKEDIDTELSYYLTENDLNPLLHPELILMISGHSRGAATANLLAADYDSRANYNTENIYCYTFATPNNTKDKNISSQLYNNIFNIVYTTDIVPSVAPRWLDYNKYGITYSLPDPYSYCNYKTGYEPSVKALYTSYTGEEYEPIGIEDYAGAIIGIQSDHKKSLSKSGKFMRALGKVNKYLNVIFTATDLYQKILCAHNQAGYLSWMQTIASPADMSRNFANYKVLRIACPVDVEVFDSKGTKLGQIISDEVDPSYNDVSLMDLNEIKYAFLPEDDEYSIKITATDDGEMNYSVFEYNEDGLVSRSVNAYGIELEKGMTFQASVDSAAGTDKKNYRITTSDNRTIVPELEIDETQYWDTEDVEALIPDLLAEFEGGSGSGGRTEEIVATGGAGQNAKWTLYADGVMVFSGNGRLNDYSYGFDSFGDESTNIPWTQWKDGGYSSDYHGTTDYRSSIKSVVIEPGITYIGSNTFRGCSKLTSVEIPDSVTGIGDSTFYGLGACKNITVPSGLEQLGSEAFCGCGISGTLVVPKAITEIPKNAFNGCANLTGVTLHDGITAIGDGAFSNCTKLKSFSIPDSVTSIGTSILSGCMVLSKLEIGGGITKIPKYAFSNLPKLLEIEIGEGVTSIGEYSFGGDTSLTKLTLPDSLVDIGSDFISFGGSFQGCTSLNTISFGKGLKIIGPHAFSDTGIYQLTLPDGLETIGEYAFEHCSRLNNVVIPDSVTSLGKCVFVGCTSLNNLELGDGIKIIPSSAFGSSGVEHVVLGKHVEEIENGAFYGCKNLESIELPSSLHSIGTSAFSECTNLQEIELPDSVENLGIYTFFRCYGLKRVRLSNQLEEIPDYAFYNCDLQELVIPDSVKSIGDSAFGYNSNLKSVSLSESLENMGVGCFSDCKSLVEIVIPKGVDTIPSDAFKNCTSLKSIILPDTVQFIDNVAFYECTSLEEVVLGQDLSRIDFSAFYNCRNLREITIPENVSTIGNQVFWYCSNMKSITFQGNAPYIGDNCFAGDTMYAFYPDNDDTWTSYVMKDYGGKITWHTICEHSAGNTVIENHKDANCKSEGSEEKVNYCTKCGVELSREKEVLPKTEHQWGKGYVVTQATYDKEGEYVYYCKACGQSKYESIPKLDKVSIADANVSKIDNMVYSGRGCEPQPVVKLGGYTLYKGSDYKLSYKDNINIGKATVTITGIGKYTGTVTKTFMILPGKTTRGDMFNLANNVKVTWKEVPGAKYYKVYREGITDPKESRKDPVIVTDRPIGWDKDPGLNNGHAYRYKIVASTTGKGDSSGDSPLSYSKLMYRLKTVVIRSVKNTAAGKVTVKYDKTTSGDSYVLQYCERQDMVGAKTKVVLGANNTSYVIGGLKKGKTYYISIRVRKKVNGIDYYTTFGVPKKVTVTK